MEALAIEEISPSKKEPFRVTVPKVRGVDPIMPPSVLMTSWVRVRLPRANESEITTAAGSLS
jgi:hypothetical protein